MFVIPFEYLMLLILWMVIFVDKIFVLAYFCFSYQILNNKYILLARGKYVKTLIHLQNLNTQPALGNSFTSDFGYESGTLHIDNIIEGRG